MNKLIIITGKTASGKDTLIIKILEGYLGFKKVLTSTSRAPRKGEKNGIDYSFISKAEFKQKISRGDFLEYVEYGGNYYGTEKSQINPGEDLIWKIDPSMAGKAKQIFPDSTVIYITADNRVVLERLKERGLTQNEIDRRMKNDADFWEKYKDNYDFVVENIPGKLNETINKIYNIILNS